MNAVNTQAATEYVVRLTNEANQPGKLVAGPFGTAHEAINKCAEFDGAKVFQETWLQ